MLKNPHILDVFWNTQILRYYYVKDRGNIPNVHQKECSINLWTNHMYTW